MELKAEQLRIGNLVFGRRGGNSGIKITEDVPREIHAIGTVNVLTQTQWTTNALSFLYNDLRPIPLTEDWLLKFGFSQTNYGFWSERLAIRVCENGGYFFDREGTIQTECLELEWVHQLQNLYHSLTGEELQLKEEIKFENGSSIITPRGKHSSAHGITPLNGE